VNRARLLETLAACRGTIHEAERVIDSVPDESSAAAESVAAALQRVEDAARAAKEQCR
jgi:hypothetical protein